MKIARNRFILFLRTLLVVVGGLGSASVLAQDEDAAPAEDAKQLEKVVITGSRIARTEIEGPSPVVIIDREQIEREGFTTVQDVLKSLSQANGVVQNEIFGGFTQNANSIDLRGLGPGRLLLLVDGRRAADYPLPYNGESNIVNISALPLVAVDRIEVLSGGASAIYGSDAVAGVVNIVLRRDLGNSLDMNVRVGDTSDGGMETLRLQAVGGFLGRKWNITYAAEYMDRDPLYAYQRSFMDSNDDTPSPNGGVTSLNAIELELFNFYGVDMGPDGCDAFTDQVYSVSRTLGPHCGNKTVNAEQTLVNAREQINFYTAASLELGDRHEIYGTFNYFQVDAENDSNYRFFQRQVFDPNSPDTFLLDNFGVEGAYTLTQRTLGASEIGGPNLWTNDEEVIDFSIGFRGELFSPLWSYDIIYSSSEYDLEEDRRLIVNSKALDLFYDVICELCDPFGFGFSQAVLDRDVFFADFTPELWAQITELSPNVADSSNETITAVIRGDLFELPAGPVAMAAVLESGSQEYDITLDQNLVDSILLPFDDWYYFGLTGSGGGGERDRLAVGTEFQIPITSKLNMSAAVRWDEYDTGANTADAITYNVGLEYRPNSRLLLRATQSTSFRAPDMHFLFADPSGFFTNVDDLYLCRRDEPDVPIDECSNSDVNIQGQRVGNPNLEEEEGDSLTFGFVWEPIDNLTLSADFYEIDLSQAVVDNPLARILELEADCRLGEKDINSGECIDAVGRVTRRPDDGTFLGEQIDLVETGPVNASTLAVQGIDATLRYSNETSSGWNYGFDLGWSHSLSFDYAVFPEDEPEDIRSRGTRDWRSRVRGSFNLGYKDFYGTLFGERFGTALSDDNIAGVPGRDLGAIATFNLTMGYRFLDDRASVSVIVNNLLDEQPKEDSTNTGWPYFDIFNYGQFVIGRTVYGQFQYRFDY
jgi:outer membrane receptor protein involved in Fe transport